jgi:hypothetical protein
MKYKLQNYFYEHKKNKRIYPAYIRSRRKLDIDYYKKDNKFIRIYNSRAKKFDYNMRFITIKEAKERYPQYFI